jgi:hypothetical protein
MNYLNLSRLFSVRENNMTHILKELLARLDNVGNKVTERVNGEADGNIKPNDNN